MVLVESVVWLGSVVVRTLDLRSTDCGFDSQPPACLICVCVPILLCFPRQLRVISLTVFGTSVTNLNEPPRTLSASTIAWVRS